MTIIYIYAMPSNKGDALFLGLLFSPGHWHGFRRVSTEAVLLNMCTPRSHFPKHLNTNNELK